MKRKNDYHPPKARGGDGGNWHGAGIQLKGQIRHRKASGQFAAAPHKLTATQRNALPASQFALPKLRKYPIPDRYHAELALRLMHSENGTTRTKIRQAIARKFPDLAT